MNLSLEEISKAVGGNLSGSGSTKVRGYSIDTRTLSAGELFFAIKGPRFDGHDFLDKAAEKKAAGAVVDAAAVGAL
jgi:UDP-N-acetylmuramoyl-tripeptide--D-alanyl-D-alanine ligase